MQLLPQESRRSHHMVLRPALPELALIPNASIQPGILATRFQFRKRIRVLKLNSSLLVLCRIVQEIKDMKQDHCIRKSETVKEVKEKDCMSPLL
jgi:hypothetical protein